MLSRFQNSTDLKPLNLKTTGALGLSFLIPSVLFLSYYFSRSHLSNGVFLETQVLIDWFKSIRPLVGYNFQTESIHTKKILYALVVLGAAGLVVHVKIASSDGKKKRVFSNCFYNLQTFGLCRAS